MKRVLLYAGGCARVRVYVLSLVKTVTMREVHDQDSKPVQSFVIHREQVSVSS